MRFWHIASFLTEESEEPLHLFQDEVVEPPDIHGDHFQFMIHFKIVSAVNSELKIGKSVSGISSKSEFLIREHRPHICRDG